MMVTGGPHFRDGYGWAMGPHSDPQSRAKSKAIPLHGMDWDETVQSKPEGSALVSITRLEGVPPPREIAVSASPQMLPIPPPMQANEVGLQRQGATLVVWQGQNRSRGLQVSQGQHRDPPA